MSTDVQTENGYLKIANGLYNAFYNLHISSAVLNQSIINGWKGIFQLKNKISTNKKPIDYYL